MYHLLFSHAVELASTYGKEALNLIQVITTGDKIIKGTRGFLWRGSKSPTAKPSATTVRQPDADEEVAFPLYRSRFMTAGEVEEIYELERSLIGDICSFQDYLRDFRKNSEMTHVLERITIIDGKAQLEIAGIFELHPVTTVARDRLLSGDLLGIDLEPDHYVQTGEPAAAVYIGGVAAITTFDKGAIERFVERELYQVEFAGSDRLIIATAATELGLSLAKRNEFLPNNAMKTGVGQVYVRHLPRRRGELRSKAGQV